MMAKLAQIYSAVIQKPLEIRYVKSIQINICGSQVELKIANTNL